MAQTGSEIEELVVWGEGGVAEDAMAMWHGLIQRENLLGSSSSYQLELYSGEEVEHEGEGKVEEEEEDKEDEEDGLVEEERGKQEEEERDEVEENKEDGLVEEEERGKREEEDERDEGEEEDDEISLRFALTSQPVTIMDYLHKTITLPPPTYWNKNKVFSDPYQTAQSGSKMQEEEGHIQMRGLFSLEEEGQIDYFAYLEEKSRVDTKFVAQGADQTDFAARVNNRIERWRKKWRACKTESEKERLFEIELAREQAAKRASQLQSEREPVRKTVAAAKKEMEEVLKVMELLPGNISSLLSKTGPADGARRGLTFMEKELRTIVEALRRLAAPTANWPEHVDPRIKARLTHLRDLADWTGDLLHYGHAARRASEFPELKLAWIEQLLLANADACHDHIGSSTTMASADEPQLSQPRGRLFGIEGRVKKLVGWLRAAADREEASKSSLRVMCIVGPPGVGKSTLAMEVCRQIGRQCFECHAVAKMSRRPPGTRKLIKHIMSQIIASTALASSERSQALAVLKGDKHELMYDMNKFLQDKRYLVVIDDLWRISDWEAIKNAFPHNNSGCQIIITSRVRNIGRSCCSHEDGIHPPQKGKEKEDGVHPPQNGKKEDGIYRLVYEVKPLGELDSERLFMAEAFGSSCSCPSDHLRQVSNEILRRCDGIPLYIIGMARLMKQEQAEAGDKTAAYWLDRIPQLKQVEDVLYPSYDDLPYDLKLFSLYMSTFPRGYRIDKHRLVRKWEAEGLIPPDTGKAIEELAEEYFSGLVDRDIIRLVTCRNNDSEVESWYQINDFMLEFLASVSAQRNFVAASRTLNSPAAAGDNKARNLERMSLHHPDPELPLLMERMDFSHTRSLTISSQVDRVPLDRFTHLVVLDLESWQNLEDGDIVQICRSSFRLKYLSVRYTRVSKLPPQINELSYLETLDISHTQISELPSQVLELPELRVLDLRSTRVSRLPRFAYWEPRLQHLLLNGDKLDLTVTEVPEHIVDCQRLETLETVDLSNRSVSFINSIGRLESLKVLAVTWSFHQCYDRRYQEALGSSIQKLRRLESLTIHCELGCSMEFLDSLPKVYIETPRYPPGLPPQAPPDGLSQNLRNLRITSRFFTVPKWIGKLNNLAVLQITVCKLAPDDLKLLGTLRRLECLVLGLDFLPEGAIAISSDGFSQLLRLTVECWVPWLEFGERSMPKLTDLDLMILSTSPPGLQKEQSGITNLLSLEQVTFRYYPCHANSRSVNAVVGSLRRQVAELGRTVRFVNNGVEEDMETILVGTHS